MVSFEEIFQELKACGTDQNIKVYKRHGAQEPLFGVSFANFNKLKKKVVSDRGKKGMNQEIAEKLWHTGNADARILAAMIAEPDKIEASMLDQWVEEADFYPIADGLATLAHKTPFALDKLSRWCNASREYVKRTGFTMLCSFTKEKEPRSNDFYLPFIQKAEQELQSASNRAKEGMNNSLIAMGAVNEKLRDRVLEAAGKIGPVEIDHGETNCKTFIIEEYLQKIYDRRAARLAKEKR